MKMDIIKIGNSKGIRLPQAVLKQCGIESQVELEIKDNYIILKPISNPREGWAEAFKLMHKNKDDVLLIPEEIDADLLEEWDEPKH
jgi:antitoxin MazE